jgi:NAD(P)-dependent dehydrogenase (short-subunit alcohol dehydrogenase family)
VRALAGRVRERLGADDIDALVLNAGRAERPTVDGFEPTFAINHLAHYLLLRLLEDRLARRATVVLTTSSTHDPDPQAPIPPPRHADAGGTWPSAAGVASNARPCRGHRLPYDHGVVTPGATPQ